MRGRASGAPRARAGRREPPRRPPAPRLPRRAGRRAAATGGRRRRRAPRQWRPAGRRRQRAEQAEQHRDRELPQDSRASPSVAGARPLSARPPVRRRSARRGRPRLVLAANNVESRRLMPQLAAAGSSPPSAISLEGQERGRQLEQVDELRAAARRCRRRRRRTTRLTRPYSSISSSRIGDRLRAEARRAAPGP